MAGTKDRIAGRARRTESRGGCEGQKRAVSTKGGSRSRERALQTQRDRKRLFGEYRLLRADLQSGATLLSIYTDRSATHARRHTPFGLSPLMYTETSAALRLPTLSSQPPLSQASPQLCPVVSPLPSALRSSHRTSQSSLVGVAMGVAVGVVVSVLAGMLAAVLEIGRAHV